MRRSGPALFHTWLLLVVLAQTLGAQTVYNTSFNAGHGWTLNTYTNLNTGVEGDSPNPWYVSDKESNKGLGNRGGANCGNVTLHVGSTTIGDGGAAFDAGGCTNLGFGPCASCVANGLYCVQTDRSSTSPLISTVGYTGLTLSFLYIHWGTALLDNGQVIYSVDGGITWTLLANVPKSGCCTGAASCLTGCTNNAACTGSHQGKWSSFSMALPVSCENISTLKLGFRWYNDDVSTGAKDPSIAVDDVTITTSVLPVRASLLEAAAADDHIALGWDTYSEQDNMGFVIERAGNGLDFTPVALVQPKGHVDTKTSYHYDDHDVKPGQLYYYRYRQHDADGSFYYSNIVSGQLAKEVLVFPNPASDIVYFSFDHGGAAHSIQVCNLLGEVVFACSYPAGAPESLHAVNLKDQPQGVYVYKIDGLGKTIVGKLTIGR